MRSIRILLAGLVAAIVCVLLLQRIEVSSVDYRSHSDAVDAKALGEGKWLPGDLPESATEISETHDADTNEVWFTYQSDPPSVPARCRRISWPELRSPRSGRAPAEISRGLEAARGAADAAAFSCRGDAFEYFLVFDFARSRGYGWSLGD